jgi:hypothetical protein
VHAEPVHEDELNWAGRWQDPALPRLLRWDKKNQCWSFLGLVLLSWWSPLQPGEVGPYLVWSLWFPSRLPLEGTGPYRDLLGHNQRSAVPGVQDLNKGGISWHCLTLASICCFFC